MAGSLREQITELEQRLRDAAKQQDPIAAAAIKLVQLSLEQVKESLVDAAGDDMLRMQGAARQLTRLHKELTTAPPSIQEPIK